MAGGSVGEERRGGVGVCVCEGGAWEGCGRVMATFAGAHCTPAPAPPAPTAACRPHACPWLRTWLERGGATWYEDPIQLFEQAPRLHK